MERKIKVKESKLKIGSGGSKALSSYLKSESEENDGVKGAEKTLDLNSKTLDGLKDYQRKALKRKRMKSQMYKRYKEGIVKESFKDRLVSIIREVKKVIVKNTKKVSIGVLSILILFVFIFQMSSILGGLFSNFNNGILSTTYLSEEPMLIAMNQSYSTRELNLENSLNRIRENYPGYDEYIINKQDEIGHDTHVLLSYLTSRFGNVQNLSDVEGEIERLFNEVYLVEYREETETRYDSDGNPYVYKRLIVTVKKNDMDKIIREKFKDSPDNLKHYEMLLESKGNMGYLFGNDGLGIKPDGVSNIYDFNLDGGIFPPPDPKHIASLNGGYAGQCTWYIYNRFSQLGKPIKYSPMGNGGEWAGYAQRYGYNVSRVSRAGTAMCFPSGVGGASRNYGHIAFVEKVNEDGSVVVSEMNIKGEFIISTRTIPKEVASKCYFIDFGL